MKHVPLSSWVHQFSPRFEQYVPRDMNTAWLTRFVDHPRFGWDLNALNLGFTQPLYRFIDERPLAEFNEPLSAHSRFMRAALCCALIQVLSGPDHVDPLDFDMEMSALELHALASTMLDHVQNGRNLAASKGYETKHALPVLITAAYSARQLATSMMWESDAVTNERRHILRQRFGRFLMLQGIGHTLDIWSEEASHKHASIHDLAQHLRWYVSPLDFELVCELVAAAVELDDQTTQHFVKAGSDLGLAWYCELTIARTEQQLITDVSPLRWNAVTNISLQQALREISVQSRRSGLDALHRICPACVKVFEQFLTETVGSVQVNTPLCVEAA